VTVELEERADAAWGAWRVSKTALGDEVLALAADGVPLGLSVGFLEVAGGSRWSPDRCRVTRTRAALDHVAVVRVGARTPELACGAYGPPTARCWPIRWPRWPGCAMGKAPITFTIGRAQGRCIGCERRFAGPGDRCPPCRRRVRTRAAKRRRRR
jgi:hypothetical protein